MDKSSIIGLIIAGLLILALGGGLGVFFQIQKDAPQISESEILIKGLSSKVVPYIVAYGQVEKIEGRDIVLNSSEDSLRIKMRQGAQVSSSSSFVASNTKNNQSSSVRPETKFEDIKVGDRLNITLKVSPEGALIGQSVLILSSNTIPASK